MAAVGPQRHRGSRHVAKIPESVVRLKCMDRAAVPQAAPEVIENVVASESTAIQRQGAPYDERPLAA